MPRWIVIPVLLTLSLVARSEFLPQFTDTLDRELEQALADGRFSSAALVAVENGQVLFSKGYGMQDWPALKPFDPQNSRTVIASITKTFTGTALAQLLADGSIESLEDPANKYLKRIQLPNWNDTPVRVVDLATHRGGLNTKVRGMAGREQLPSPIPAGQLPPLVPELVRKPGVEVDYSNDGVAVLGLLIEDVSGLSLRDYFRQHIFTPLQMTGSDLSYDVNLDAETAVAYIGTGKGAQRMPYIPNTVYMAAAGSVHTTPADMARYMNAQLGLGHAAANLYSQDSRELAQNLIVKTDGGTRGIGLGFMVSDWNGQKVVEHGGARVGYNSAMTLLPGLDIGVFITVVGEPVAGREPYSPFSLTERLAKALLGPYVIDPVPAVDFSTDWSGRYWHEGRPWHDPAVLPSVYGIKRLTQDARGIYLDGDGPYRHQGEGVFEKAAQDGNPPERIVAFLDRDLHPTLQIGLGSYKRVGVLDDPIYTVIGGIAGIALGLASLLLVLWRRRAPVLPVTLFAGLTCGAAALVIYLSIPGLDWRSQAYMDTVYNGPWFQYAKQLALVFLLLTGIYAACAWLLWRRGPMPGGLRIHILAGLLGFLLLARYFSFLSLY